jgi:hypothetical protein
MLLSRARTKGEAQVPNRPSKLDACLETLEALIRSGVPNAIVLAERAVDDFAGREPDVMWRIEALHAVHEGVENMAVSGARLDAANAILAYIEKRLEELQRND